MTFKPGDPVEYDSAYTERTGAGKRDRKVIRGVYVKRVNADFSDVTVAGKKALLVRTNRLRLRSIGQSGGNEAA